VVWPKQSFLVEVSTACKRCVLYFSTLTSSSDHSPHNTACTSIATQEHDGEVAKQLLVTYEALANGRDRVACFRVDDL